jgi:hypothetical protein
MTMFSFFSMASRSRRLRRRSTMRVTKRTWTGRNAMSPIRYRNMWRESRKIA